MHVQSVARQWAPLADQWVSAAGWVLPLALRQREHLAGALIPAAEAVDVDLPAPPAPALGEAPVAAELTALKAPPALVAVPALAGRPALAAPSPADTAGRKSPAGPIAAAAGPAAGPAYPNRACAAIHHTSRSIRAAAARRGCAAAGRTLRSRASSQRRRYWRRPGRAQVWAPGSQMPAAASRSPGPFHCHCARPTRLGAGPRPSEHARACSARAS